MAGRYEPIPDADPEEPSAGRTQGGDDDANTTGPFSPGATSTPGPGENIPPHRNTSMKGSQEHGPQSYIVGEKRRLLLETAQRNIEYYYPNAESLDLTISIGIGIVIGAPLASVSALCGFASAGMAGATKKLESKISKHEKIYTLAIAKRDSISGLVSKALDDNKVTDDEFKIINSEISKYRDLKASVRRNFKQADSHREPDLEKIRKDIRCEEREKLQKKIISLSAESKLDLKK
ncbi:hypothetical protein OS493_022170 [Desmophyllum pertusum]|uniref:Uncharacterized protein n=1 Tax=Desmophyllum pertusum TaxID=174260 RepID=A0A9X0CLB3_9CNID|nr:hypothetical protein OS493_022170 [Desmophyllum pertusum]